MPTKPSLTGFQVDYEWAFTYDAQSTPEENLITAIIARAIADLFDKQKNVRRDARKWFISRETHIVFSYLWCLTQLGKEDIADKISTKILCLDNFSFQARRRSVKECRTKTHGVRHKRLKRVELRV